MRWTWAALVVVLACDNATSPTTPAASNQPPASSTTITGHVVQTVSRAPVAGAQVESSGTTVRTDASGLFQMTALSAVVPVTLSAPNHVSHRTFLSASVSAPTLDIIETGSLWNLDFYRELARNGAGGGNLVALNPWTIEPRFYIDQSPESGSGREIPPASVELVKSAIGQVLPLLTSGRLQGSQIEVGTSPPADQSPGTVVVRWDPVEIAETAGAASGITRGVGGNASVVVLRTIEETRAIYHELGHVLGLYHPLGGIRPSLMAGSGTLNPPHFTQWDVFHAQIVYARPPGNTDIDNDPSGFVAGASALRADRFSPTVTICALP